MKLLAELIKIIFIVAAIVLVIPLALTLSAYVGYFFGIIVSWTAGGILTGVFGIETTLIPKIIAWLFVLSSIVGAGIKLGGSDNEE